MLKTDCDNPYEDDANPKEAPESVPGYTAFLDQEQASFHETKEHFYEAFGFEHECRCAKDYSSGNTFVVTGCYLQLASEALSMCYLRAVQFKIMTGMVSKLTSIVSDLSDILIEKGHEDSLKEYMSGDVNNEKTED